MKNVAPLKRHAAFTSPTVSSSAAAASASAAVSCLNQQLPKTKVREMEKVKKRKYKNLSLALQSRHNQMPASSSSTSQEKRMLDRITEQKHLPIYQHRQSLLTALDEHQVLILVGETGSGKTTQCPKFFFQQQLEDQLKQTPQLKRRNTKKIAITQPRRVAAISVATRVAEEVGCVVGDTVGYAVRFDDKTSPQTRLKFMTDGMLVREAMLSPTLDAYSMVVLDEAHERTLQTDILFGIVKAALKKRKDLKVIVMSATLDIQLFESFFEDTVVIKIPGRQHPVQIFYTEESQKDYLDSALLTTLQIHTEETDNPGSILVFLTGQEDIETLEELLHVYARTIPADQLNLLVCPIYAAMPPEQQMKVFEAAPPGTRKVILATNIAETSITISGVRFVVDTGLVKQRSYIARKGLELLMIEPISQAQAWQRSGRAGREAPGVCYRLFPEAKFQDLLETAIPEICRVSLESVVLQLRCMGVADVLTFEFIEKPSMALIQKALEKLYALDALDDGGSVTPLGRQMAQLPVSPMFARMLIKSAELGCTHEALSVVAMLSVESIFYSPKEQREAADASRKHFRAFEGDHATLLSVYHQYHSCPVKQRPAWCVDHFVNHRAMRKVEDIREQLLQQLDAMKVPMLSSHPDMDPLRKAVLAGFFLNVARNGPPPQDWAGKSAYKTLSGEYVKIHPSSVLMGRNPPAKYVVYNELVCTSKNYMRNVLVVEKEWLPEIAPKFFIRAKQIT